MSYPDTYYRRSLVDTVVRPSLSGRADCDTAIIGGGLAGLTAARELARAGQSVILLERENVGFGASGRNGGFVGPGFSAGDDLIARVTGAAEARALFRLSIEGVEYVRDTIRDLSIQGADPVPGILSVRRHDSDGADLRAHVDEMARDFGYQIDYLDTPQLRELLHSKRYFQALRNPNAFHIHPLNYLRGLATEIERLGGKIYEASPVTEARLDGADKIIRTLDGEVRAARVIIATGGYTDALVPRLRRAMLPIATYVMLSEAAPDLIATAISTRHAVGDNRRAGDYYRLVDGGRRILWGGRITTRAASTEGLVRELRREMLTVYPQLAGLKTELAWSGLMSYARHLMPQIGEMAPGVWHCTAFGGHGLNTTSIGGKVVAEAILGQSDRVNLFRPFGLTWTGGPAGRMAVQLTYWKLQAQDWLRERGAAEVAK